MKKLTGEEDFKTPIIFLLLLSMLFMAEAFEITKNIETHGSIILLKPILFTGNTFLTINRFIWLFFIPATILFSAIKEKGLFLKLTYVSSTIPFILSTQVISKLGYESLYIIKIIIIFVLIICFGKYLINKTEQYKKYFKKQTDNKAASPDGSQVRHP